MRILNSIRYAITPASLIQAINQCADLPSRRRQDLVSAVRRFSRLQGRALDELAADPADLRWRLGQMSAAEAHLSPGAFRNLKSLVGQALIVAAVTSVPRRSRTPLPPEWHGLLEVIQDRHRRDSLGHFARVCAARGWLPAEVEHGVMEAYRRDLVERGLLQRPKQAHRDACLTWNIAANIKPESGLRPVIVPDFRRRYALPVSAFPASSTADLEAYLGQLGRDDPFEEQDRRPASPHTVICRRKQIVALASALVEAGRDPQGITCLAELVEPEAAKAALKVVWNRLGRRKTGYLHNLALLAVNIGRHWVKLDGPDIDRLRDLRRGADPGKGGMTRDNRRRLLQFTDPVNVAALARLPWKLMDEATRRGPSDLRAAVQAQTAVAIAILFVAPLRVGTLAKLDFDKHFVRSRPGPRGITHLVIPGELVKNKVDIELIVPSRVVRLLDIYRERFLPRLAQPSWGYLLFPGRRGPKDGPGFSKQIIAAIRKHAGLVMTTHLFRHLAGFLILARAPGEYETVKALLGHRSIETTTRFYVSMEQRAAFTRYDQIISEYLEGREFDDAAE